MMDGIAREWLQDFESAIIQRDAHAACRLFLADGWLRDSLVLSWDVRSLNGQEKILSYFQARLQDTLFIPGSFHLDTTRGLEPSQFALAAGLGIEFGVLFDAAAIHGRGFVRLQQEEVTGAWRALTVYITAWDIKGHEERTYEMGLFQGMPKNWTDIIAERRAMVESDPEALVGEFQPCIYYPSIPYFNLLLKWGLAKLGCRLRLGSGR